MNLSEFERTFNRYLKGKATEEEKQFIEHWLAIREADQQDHEEQEMIHSGSQRKQLIYAIAILLLLSGIIWQFTPSIPAAVAPPAVHLQVPAPQDSTVSHLSADSSTPPVRTGHQAISP